MSKARSKRLIIFGAIIAVIVLAVIIFNVISTVRLKLMKDRAYEKYYEVCEYVAENEDVFRHFSEYEISFLEGGHGRLDISPEGEFQDERDIVLKDVNIAWVYYTRDRHNAPTGKRELSYIIGNGGYYRVYIIYAEEGIPNFDEIYECREHRVYGDDMYVYLYEMPMELRHI